VCTRLAFERLRLEIDAPIPRSNVLGTGLWYDYTTRRIAELVFVDRECPETQ